MSPALQGFTRHTVDKAVAKTMILTTKNIQIRKLRQIKTIVPTMPFWIKN
jgi:hypothetical protein